MHFKVEPSNTLFEIRAFFHEKFPFLDITFYKTAHHEGEGNRRADMLPPQTHVSEAGGHSSGELLLHGEMKVSEIEHEFQARFGLFAQVMRKSGNVWLQTTQSDHLTLNELNNHAREANEFRPDTEDPGDYHEQE